MDNSIDLIFTLLRSIEGKILKILHILRVAISIFLDLYSLLPLQTPLQGNEQ